MGRKNLKVKRTEQILDAFEQCIVNFGLQATSLQQIADEAGMTRSILRHYVGNRAALVNALIDRLEKEDDNHRNAYIESRPGENRLEKLIGYLIDGWIESDRDSNTIAEELFVVSSRDVKLRKRLLASYESIEANISDEIEKNYPLASVDACRMVAHVIMSLAYGSSTMFWLGFDRTRYPKMRQVIKSLFQALENEESASLVWLGKNISPALFE